MARINYVAVHTVMSAVIEAEHRVNAGVVDFETVLVDLTTRLRGSCMAGERRAALMAKESAIAPAIRARAHGIIQIVAEVSGVPFDILVGVGRARSVSHPRHLAMRLVRDRLHATVADIGAIFGGRDHSTVSYAIGSSYALLKLPHWAEMFEDAKARVG